MTSRRGRSTGSGQPGTRAWRESIQGIRRELNANNGRLFRVLEEQDSEYADDVQPLLDLAQNLRVEELLSYMNDTLLDGQGVIQTVLLWDEQQVLADDDFGDEDDEEDDWEEDDEEEGDEDEEDEEDEDDSFELFAVLTVMLSWKAAGKLQIRVEVQEEDEEIEMHVNGRPVDPPNARNLQSALVEAFREQMDENYGQDEEE